MPPHDFNSSVSLPMVGTDNQQHGSILQAVVVIDGIRPAKAYTIEKSCDIKCATRKQTDGLNFGISKPGAQQRLDSTPNGRELPEDGGYKRLRSYRIFSHMDSFVKLPD
jgi:hypothetical protein